MKKLLPVLLIALLTVSCNKPMGELVGQGNKGTFRDANPYGMVYIRPVRLLWGQMIRHFLVKSTNNRVK